MQIYREPSSFLHKTRPTSNLRVGVLFCCFVCHRGARLKFMKEIPLEVEVHCLIFFPYLHFVYWQQLPTFWNDYCLTLHGAFHCLFRRRQWNTKNLQLPCHDPVLGLCFWTSLWSAAGLIGWSPGGTWCRCCTTPFSLWQMWWKVLAASEHFWPPGSNRSQEFPLESFLEALHGNEG